MWDDPRVMLPLLLLLLQGAGAPAKGLWIGSVHVCRDTVESVRKVRDLGGGPALRIRFRPAMQPAFGEETARLVGRPLSIRLDGRELSAPTVNEAILGLEAQVSGPDARTVKAAAKAAKKRC